MKFWLKPKAPEPEALNDLFTRAPNGDCLLELPAVTRVELIDYRKGGRFYSNWDAREVAISVQDGGRTLKVFVS